MEVVAETDLGCRISLSNPGPEGRRGEPVTIGLPLPRGFAREVCELGLVDEHATPVPAQIDVLQRWPDHSVRWALVDFQADVPNARASYALVRTDRATAPASPLAIERQDASIVLGTGAATFHIDPRRGVPFAAARNDATGASIGALEVSIVANGAPLPIGGWQAHVDVSGPLRTVVRLTGIVTGAPTPAAITCRLTFYAGSAVARVDWTVRNPNAAAHPGGIWELGGKTSFLFDAMTVHVPLGFAAASAHVSLTRATDFVPAALPLALTQHSSAGAAWQSRAHVTRTGRGPHRRGYAFESAGLEQHGDRAEPIVVVADEARAVGLTAQDFWQNFPKAIAADGEALHFSLFPAVADEPHELQGGEQKTHTFWLSVAADPVASSLTWCRSPLRATIPSEAFVRSEAVSYFAPIDEHADPTYESLVASAIDGPDSMVAKREIIDEYGWRNFGDIYADHENAFSSDPRPIISHYNNQYDAVAGFAYQWFRSGDARWHTLMLDLARHVVDIDIYHTDQDRALYSRGMFWHTFHYRDAGRSTHRSYPNAPGVTGGGPSAEHNYGTGLMLAYYITGEPAFRDAVLGLGRWVIAMDDGRKGALRWIDHGPTGWATATGTMDYHGPGRASANSIQALLNAFEASADPVFLAKADEIIRRCIHPADDLEALDLLDAERRWYYTVFLQALGRYLAVKIERAENDQMYAYAQASLLHYARWMRVHEYPYLEQPHKLEFPTETWAAQDMRKSEVFDLASYHSRDPQERERFRERAAFFFRVSTETLASAPTHTLARPTVLMLSYGFRHGWFRKHPEVAAPAARVPVQSLPRPTRFEPQKTRVLRRAKITIGAAGVVGFLGIAGCWLTR